MEKAFPSGVVGFAYSAAQESIVEVGSREEYESCDTSNPIRMFIDGLDSVSLEKEGFRYFTSGKEESCKKGLKIPVEVQGEPRIQMVTSVATSESAALALAEGPTSASSPFSVGLNKSHIVAMLVWVLGIFYMAEDSNIREGLCLPHKASFEGKNHHSANINHSSRATKTKTNIIKVTNIARNTSHPTKSKLGEAISISLENQIPLQKNTKWPNTKKP
ncbi:Phytocyanin domain [Dillenia turbinata]|uniref:Phytocyanin domain n=1 Tax=Dillenia turbinata TaxID=194707 RepID=A0AAN8UUF9_9MAGN